MRGEDYLRTAKGLLVAATMVLLLGGCGAGEAEYAAYYSAVQSQNSRVMEIEQSARQDHTRAMTEALIAARGNETATVAIALMYAMEGRHSKSSPLSEIRAPETNSEIIRAATPVLSNAVSWVAGAWAVDKLIDGAGSSYSVSDGSTMNTITQTSGGDSSINLNEAIGENSTNGEAQTEEVDIDAYDQCEEDGGWYSGTCSCHSHYLLGKC